MNSWAAVFRFNTSDSATVRFLLTSPESVKVYVFSLSASREFSDGGLLIPDMADMVEAQGR